MGRLRNMRVYNLSSDLHSLGVKAAERVGLVTAAWALEFGTKESNSLYSVIKPPYLKPVPDKVPVVSFSGDIDFIIILVNLGLHMSQCV